MLLPAASPLELGIHRQQEGSWCCICIAPLMLVHPLMLQELPLFYLPSWSCQISTRSGRQNSYNTSWHCVHDCVRVICFAFVVVWTLDWAFLSPVSVSNNFLRKDKAGEIGDKEIEAKSASVALHVCSSTSFAFLHCNSPAQLWILHKPVLLGVCLFLVEFHLMIR